MLQYMFRQVLNRAAAFLLSKQDPDGFWRDYQLEVGSSDSWITAVVGNALFKTSGKCLELEKAVAALAGVRRKQGWGYNGLTACDADTTSAVIRFFAVMNALDDINVAEMLDVYINPFNYRVRTFDSTKRFGSWAWEHDEVTPVAGMALWAAKEFNLAICIRQAVLSASIWHKFWWRCASYATARNLEFLNETGGIPEEVRIRETNKLEKSDSFSSAFDLAQQISSKTLLKSDVSGTNLLLEMQLSDGSWPPSAALLVPDQYSGVEGHAEADNERLITTASAMLSILQVENILLSGKA